MTGELLREDQLGFYLVRHGQTAGNANRYLGWTDEPLDEIGKRQALQIGRRLGHQRIDAIYSSPFSRTVATASPLAERCGLRVVTQDALKELNFGDYQGLAKADHRLRIRIEHAERPVPGGESLRDVATRLSPFIAEMCEQLRTGSRVVIVTHFWTARVLLGTLRALPITTMMSQLDYKPAVGSVLAVTGAFRAGRSMSVRRAWPITLSNAAEH